MSSPHVLRCLILTLAALALAASVFAAPKRNLLEDGASFEVGTDGFSLNNQYLLSHHGHVIVPVFDSDTAVDGARSLRLDNPLGDKIVLTFRPFRVPQKTAVTVSGYLKGDGKVHVQLMRWPYESVGSADVDLAPDWRRFSFPGTVKDDQNYFLWIMPTVETRQVWVDALQIEEGELGDFHPKPLELGVSASAPYNTYWIGDQCALQIHLYAPRPEASILVSVKVLDLFRDEVVNTTVAVATHGQQHVTTTLPLFPADKRGSYKAIVEAGQGESAEKEVITFAVLKEVSDADPFFAFNLKQVYNEDSERRHTDNNADWDLVYANAPLDYSLGLMRKAGANSLRCFRIAEHPRIERAPGEFVWRDTYVDLQNQAGLEGPLVVLNPAGPKWDADPAFAQGRAAISTVEEWRNYVRAMVTHYRGKVKYYEVVNEPETIFKDMAAYVERLKAAYEVIHETDPEARVVAPSYSGGQPFAWIDAFCKAGGHQWTDIWAIHYAGRTLPERGMDRTTPTWEVIRRYRDILVQANGGKDKPFWNTEGGSFYWAPEYDQWPSASEQGFMAIGDEHYRVPTEPLVAAYVPRLQLIEKACGIDREYSFEFGYYYSQNASKATDLWSMYVNYDGTPSPALVTYNAVADIFAGTRPVGLVPLEGNVVVALFERDAKTVGAVWKGAPVTQYPGFERYDSPALVDVTLRPASLSVANILGHPLTAQARGEGTRITASAFPIYFTTDAAPADVLAAFRAATISDGPAPKITATPEELIAGSFYSAAVTALTDSLAANPADAKAWAMLGQSYAALKDYARAMDACGRALQLDAKLAAANAGMARCLEAYGQPGVSWAARMAGAADCMGRALADTTDRVSREGKGSYQDLSDIYQYFYYLSGATHIKGNAARALEMIRLAKLTDPSAANFRTQRMLGLQKKLEDQAARDAGK